MWYELRQGGELMIWIITIMLINIIIGTGVCVALDTKKECFYNWYKQDPTGGLMCFLVLIFWPVMAFFMIRYKRQKLKGESCL